jgi:hypothetical protein
MFTEPHLRRSISGGDILRIARPAGPSGILYDSNIEPAQPCRCAEPIQEDFTDQTAPETHATFIGNAIREELLSVTHPWGSSEAIVYKLVIEIAVARALRMIVPSRRLILVSQFIRHSATPSRSLARY